jgi:hypothetical protein
MPIISLTYRKVESMNPTLRFSHLVNRFCFAVSLDVLLHLLDQDFLPESASRGQSRTTCGVVAIPNLSAVDFYFHFGRLALGLLLREPDDLPTTAWSEDHKQLVATHQMAKSSIQLIRKSSMHNSA